MRTTIFLIFLALTDIAKAINTLAGKANEPLPQNVLTFLMIVFWIVLVMDVAEFFKKLSK